MSITLEFSAHKSHLEAKYFPPIELNASYECGLVSLFTYNSIPNVNAENNKFYVDEHIIEIPFGSYEVNDIVEYITNKLKQLDSKINVTITPNLNTFKTEIKTTHNVYFNKANNVGKLFGFGANRIIEANKSGESDLPVNITSVTSIRVVCNIVNGAYMNNKPSQVLHVFSPDVEVGYKISEVPSNIIYLPVNVNSIQTVDIKLIDQNDNMIDFRNENIAIRLHLRPRI